MRSDGCAGCVARSGCVCGRELGTGARARGRASGRAERWGARSAGARGALGRAKRWGARSAGASGALAGARQDKRARGWAHGARGARPAGSTGAQPVRASWASWARLGFCAL